MATKTWAETVAAQTPEEFRSSLEKAIADFEAPVPPPVTIEIDAKKYEDYDDCLAAAAADYAAAHGLRGWDLSPRWADDALRDVILLTVPAGR